MIRLIGMFVCIATAALISLPITAILLPNVTHWIAGYLVICSMVLIPIVVFGIQILYRCSQPINPSD